jgi:hypothetical protein
MPPGPTIKPIKTQPGPKKRPIKTLPGPKKKLIKMLQEHRKESSVNKKFKINRTCFDN